MGLGYWADGSDTKAGHKDSDTKQDKKKAGFQPVVKGAFLQLSDSDQTLVGLQFQNRWVVAVSGGKPVPLTAAVVGTLRVAKDVSIIEAQTAMPADGGWKLQGDSMGLLIQGSLAAPVAVSEIGRRAGGGWQLHGKHGAKDKLPADVESALQDDDQVEFQGAGAPAVWMTYPVGKEDENPGGWATTGHSRGQIRERRSELEKDAKALPEPLRHDAQAHLDVMAVVSSVEGGYSATSGQVADISGSLGIFQWARSRDPSESPDSIDRMFERMKKRADAGAEKVQSKQSPSPEEDLAIKAWKQTQDRGIGIENHHTTFKHGKADPKPASGLDLELAMANSTGLEDAGRASQALLDSANLKDRIRKVHEKSKGKSVEEQKQDEAQLLGTLLQQLTSACKDVLASDLTQDKDSKGGKDNDAKSKLEALLAKLEPKKEAIEKGTKDARPADTQAKPVDPIAALDRQIQDKTALIREADRVLRPIIDHKIKSAPAMATDEMRKYQLVAALDTIQAIQSKPVYLEHQDYYPNFCPGIRTPNSGTVDLLVEGRTLHLEHHATLVGQFLKSEKAIAEAVMLGVNRPAYVATALWKALQPTDAGERVVSLARSIIKANDQLSAKQQAAKQPEHAASHAADTKNAGKTVAKKTLLRAADVEELLKSPSPELVAIAAEAKTALAEVKAILWPEAGAVDEEQILIRFRQEALRIYNTKESKDASENNRAGRFVTVDLVDWEAIDAVKTKS